METLGKADTSTLIQTNSTHSVLRTCPTGNRNYCQGPQVAHPTFGDSFLFVNVTTQTPTYSSSPYFSVILDNDKVGWIDILVRAEGIQHQTNQMTPCFAEESIPMLSSLVEKYRLLKNMGPTWSLIFTSSNSQKFEMKTEVTIGCIKTPKGRSCPLAYLSIFFRGSAQYLLSTLGKFADIDISYNHNPPNRPPPSINTCWLQNRYKVVEFQLTETKVKTLQTPVKVFEFYHESSEKPEKMFVHVSYETKKHRRVTPISWIGAHIKCVELRGYLPVIDSEEDINILVSFLKFSVLIDFVLFLYIGLVHSNKKVI